MALSFGRIVQLSVGKRGAPSPLLISGLRITFNIEKSLETAPNKSLVEVYNLSPKSRSVFTQQNAAINLVAGYQQNSRSIFTGDIVTVTPSKRGPDILTSIEAFDGYAEYQNKEADLSFGPGTSVGTVFTQLASSFGLQTGEVQGLNTDAVYQNGVTFSGRVKDHMDTLVGQQQGLDWSIQDGALQVLPVATASTRPAVLLTPATGLIGSPFTRTVLQPEIAKKENGLLIENGVQLRSLLNPNLLPGRLVVVQAEFVNGTFKIMRVKHSGDTHGQTFYSDVEAVSV